MKESKRGRGDVSMQGTGDLPAEGIVKLPVVLTVFPVSKSTWWSGVKEGRYPKPVRLGPRAVGWRVQDIRALF